MDRLHEECGIAAVYQLNQATANPVNVLHYLPNILLDLQNRGQLSAGVTSYNPQRDCLLQTYKRLGDVAQVFKINNSQDYQSLIDRYAGTAAIGHVRYATSGKDDENCAQPFERIHGRKWKWFSIAFNGNLANFEHLKSELTQKGYHITYNIDTEVMMHYFNKELSGENRRSYQDIFFSLSQQFDGAFNIAFLNAMGELVVMRGPNGIKPVCYGIKNNLLFVASESVALSRLGITDYLDLEPGTILIATKEGYSIERYAPAVQVAHCHFEWVYFANLASTLDGKSVYRVRRELGRQMALAETDPIEPQCLVVPVPETAKVAADAFGYYLGLPVVEGILRNRYVGRTFIQGSLRQKAISRKFTFIPQVLEGHSIFLVDDSLVRAATMKALIQSLREQTNVQKIHVRLACPAIIAPCFYGIDIPTRKELFASSYYQPEKGLEFSPETLQQMAFELGADSLKFLTVEQLASAIGFARDRLCTACVTAHYPTPAGRLNYERQL